MEKTADIDLTMTLFELQLRVSELCVISNNVVSMNPVGIRIVPYFVMGF